MKIKFFTATAVGTGYAGFDRAETVHTTTTHPTEVSPGSWEPAPWLDAATAAAEAHFRAAGLLPGYRPAACWVDTETLEVEPA